ncbi:HAMP domain-containing histidine kinase [Pseudoalteromonas sp. MMG013]|uniref:HAMP domain-containing sensor histidine kinase n=1 Tax=Pseudoalteromonas sp. MMG013 TaxID=2822687 RepID=UPI001B35BCB7|nr:HAMP domain-containing sensor histidine kinase [Pseudoalteromonas sp. MMG013]MBQ4863236.1 HAMP domain-containing histidine kinase [Pseudoalteromonas sp. MMG013]
MKLPHLNLYGRFFLLFTVTTILLVVFILIGSFSLSEKEAKKIVYDRHEALYEIMAKLVTGPIDIKKLKVEAKKNRVEIHITRGTQHWNTGGKLPTITVLQENATPLGKIYFTKVGAKYFVYTISNNTTIVVTSQIANLIVYSNGLTLWPWFAALCVLLISYKVLNSQLKPINTAINSAIQISQGNFKFRIEKHPKNDLSNLTQGLNAMAESLEQLFSSKNELLLSVSHELRSPMARMKVLLALLTHNETVSKLNSEINKMDEIVEQLLESERLKDSHKLVNLETYFLPNVLTGILDSFDNNPALRVEGTIPEIAIDIDFGRFKFLIRNLIENALTHSHSSSPVILTCSKESTELFIRVRDFGSGIEAEFLPKIFDPFSQATGVDNRNSQGVGLGLFLCKRIALVHGGDLSVSSEIGKGSEFTVTLPIVEHG